MNRVYNFSAGPSMLPMAVLEKAASELVCYGESGMSVMEMSHRSPDYEAIINDIFPMVYGHTDEMICADKLHLTEEGAKKVAARVADVIRDAVSK